MVHDSRGLLPLEDMTEVVKKVDVTSPGVAGGDKRDNAELKS